MYLSRLVKAQFANLCLPVARFSSPGLPLADENHGNQLADLDGQVTDAPSVSRSLELKVEAPDTGKCEQFAGSFVVKSCSCEG